jgi:hypothetical protein
MVKDQSHHGGMGIYFNTYMQLSKLMEDECYILYFYFIIILKYCVSNNPLIFFNND